MTTPDEAPTYFRPLNLDTGQPTLTTYFTAPLCELVDAHKYDLEERSAQLADDVRDHLDRIGVPIRPTIMQGRVRIMVDTEPDANGQLYGPQVFSTMMAFLTDAEPDDPRLSALVSDGFHAERIDADVVFTIPTEASEAAIEEDIAETNKRGQEYIAKDIAAKAEARRQSGPTAFDDDDDLFD